MLKFQSEIKRYDANLSLKAEHFGEHKMGVAAGAYAGVVELKNKRIEIWGYGGFKNTENLYLAGISHAIEEVSCWIEAEIFSMQVWAPSTGFLKILDDYMPKWTRNGGKNSSGDVPDGYEHAKRCYALRSLGTLSIVRVTKRQGGHPLAAACSAAKSLAKLAYENEAFAKLGIHKSGEGWASAD